MRTDIYLIITFAIQTDDYDLLDNLVGTLVKSSMAEDGCLAYEFNVNADRTRAFMVEHFTSSTALVDHINGAPSRHADTWNSLLSLSSLVVMGNPSEELRRLLPPEALYLDRVDGFTK